MHVGQSSATERCVPPQASLHDRPHLAAVLAAAAVAFRQTNAVWAGLILGSAVLRGVMGENPQRWAGASVEAQAKFVLRAAWQVRTSGTSGGHGGRGLHSTVYPSRVLILGVHFRVADMRTVERYSFHYLAFSCNTPSMQIGLRYRQVPLDLASVHAAQARAGSPAVEPGARAGGLRGVRGGQRRRCSGRPRQPRAGRALGAAAVRAAVHRRRICAHAPAAAQVSLRLLAWSEKTCLLRRPRTGRSRCTRCFSPPPHSRPCTCTRAGEPALARMPLRQSLMVRPRYAPCMVAAYLTQQLRARLSTAASSAAVLLHPRRCTRIRSIAIMQCYLLEHCGIAGLRSRHLKVVAMMTLNLAVMSNRVHCAMVLLRCFWLTHLTNHTAVVPISLYAHVG